MNLFLEEETKPLTTKRKLLIMAMIFALTPIVAWVAGKHAAMTKAHNELVRVHSMSVDVALPARLPANTWEF